MFFLICDTIVLSRRGKDRQGKCLALSPYASTKQGIASTLKKTTPTMSETESRWFCRHCWNLPQSQRSVSGPGSSPRPPSHHYQTGDARSENPTSC